MSRSSFDGALSWRLWHWIVSIALPTIVNALHTAVWETTFDWAATVGSRTPNMRLWCFLFSMNPQHDPSPPMNIRDQCAVLRLPPVIEEPPPVDRWHCWYVAMLLGLHNHYCTCIPGFCSRLAAFQKSFVGTWLRHSYRSVWPSWILSSAHPVEEARMMKCWRWFWSKNLQQ